MIGMFCILIRISVKLVPNGPIGNKSALLQLMVSRLIGDGPLPEEMFTAFIDAYMRL